MTSAWLRLDQAVALIRLAKALPLLSPTRRAEVAREARETFDVNPTLTKGAMTVKDELRKAIVKLAEADQPKASKLEIELKAAREENRRLKALRGLPVIA